MCPLLHTKIKHTHTSPVSILNQYNTPQTEPGSLSCVLTHLSKLYCAISAMNRASPTTCAMRPSASPPAQRRIGLELPRAPYNTTRNMSQPLDSYYEV